MVLYKKVNECPDPYVGLKWTEMYSYYGEVIDEEVFYGRTYYIISDTTNNDPYALTKDDFKKKFSYSSGNGCWVRFSID